MGLNDITSREAILAAVAECDRLGQTAFLRKYGFRRAQQYCLVVEGREYNSKAIVGASHGYQFPALGPLTSRDFKGGADTVQPLLEALGFTVRVGSATGSQSSASEPDRADGLLAEVGQEGNQELDAGLLDWTPQTSRPTGGSVAVRSTTSTTEPVLGLSPPNPSVPPAAAAGSTPSQPAAPSAAAGHNSRLQTVKPVLEIMAIAVTVIGGIIGLIWGVKR